MIRTLVIDDEPLLRQYIKNSIVEQNPDFLIIGEAGNGEEAWRKIKELLPDVIFIDIKMPLIDGLEVLELCSTLKNPPLSIILSGYSEFVYAQKALKQHAFDYILKPVDQELLKQLLDRVQFKLQEKFSQVQYQYFLHLLHNQKFMYTSNELQAAFADVSRFYIYYVCIGSYSTYHYNQFNTIGNFWENIDFDRRMTDSILSSEQLWILHNEPQNDCFLILASQSKIDDRKQLFVDTLLQSLENISYPSTIIYGPETDCSTDLKKHFIELTGAASNHVVFSKSSTYDLSEHSPATDDLSFFSYAEQRILCGLVTDHKIDIFQKQLEGYLAHCESHNCRQCSLSQLLKHICEIANQNQISYSLSERIDELLTNSIDYKDIRNGMQDLLNDIFHTLADTTGFAVTIQIKSYIDQRYTEQISLTHLAGKFNFSISYLSSLFKKAYHVSPNEYIIGLRIEKAKMLLADNDQTNIRQISELVGYTDPYYFSRLFKMVVGCTPSDYRNKSH